MLRTVDAHTIEVGIGALAIAAASGFGGAYLGARTTARHDRIERERQRRIAAADDLVQSYSEALFAIGSAISELEASSGLVGPAVAGAKERVRRAVQHSTR